MRATFTRLKLALVYLVIAAGAAEIFVLQWPQAVTKSGFGSSGYAQGPIGTVMLAVIMAGIPIVFWALFAYFSLTWLWFRRGEIDALRARQLLQDIEPASPGSVATGPRGKVFED